MTDKKHKKAIQDFVNYWRGRGYEKGESQVFWLSFLRDILRVEKPESLISFEEQVKLDHTSFIDGYIDTTHVMIEQKGLNKDLRKKIKQSDGTELTPFQQAKRYASELPYSKRPRWIITCNFAEFLIYDMENPNSEPESILLEDLSKEYYRFRFMVETTKNEHIIREEQISIKAGLIVRKLYNALLNQYQKPDSAETLHDLNVLCVRLVFCFYAEDSGIFDNKLMFHNYMQGVSVGKWHRELEDLFEILNTKPEDRSPYEDPELLAFPYVNGGLFADKIVIPSFTEDVVNIILNEASEGFDWSEISPTIFGAVFESTINPETRKLGGMHYTSIENIHKVIDPLFLNDLREELDEIKNIKQQKTRNDKLNNFRHKLSTLVYLDPACGSGNFLTETYISLRRLENEALRIMLGTQIVFSSYEPVYVNINQFYGIEINDFAVTVAKTALWIAEHQMLKQTESIMEVNLEFLPLKSYANIIEGNALRLDWTEVVPKEKLCYIMGNPPFIGKKEQDSNQKQDLIYVFGKNVKGIGNIDYVSAWYRKAMDIIKDTNIKVAFVSTNSICHGEQVPIIWKNLFSLGLDIDFAYKTFCWNSESDSKANVHCVIIGFSYNSNNNKVKKLYSGDKVQIANNINPYLIDAPTIIIESRSKCLSEGIPEICYGSIPIDDGNLILNEEDVNVLLKENSENAKFIRKYVGGAELIKNKERWCLWLVGASPKDINKSSFIKERVRRTSEFRKKSGRPQTLALADTPALFGEIRQPDTTMIVIPKVSSENRRYIPISYVSPDVIVNGSALIVADGSLYHFGILTSSVHMAWTRVVCGRMKSDYQYSGKVVYNNFPWCNPTPEQRKKIEQTAQSVLDARKKYPECSLSDLYDEIAMPSELRKAHQDNDNAVLEAYGFKRGITESEIVANLMKIYSELT